MRIRSVLLLVGISLSTVPLVAGIAPVVLAPPLTTPEVAVDTRPLSQSQPSISRGVVAYSDQLSPVSYTVAYIDLATGISGGTGAAGDYWPDVNDGRIVFGRRVASTGGIWLLDIASGGTTELDPAGGVTTHRQGSSIGGNTVAWVEPGAAADQATSEVWVHELSTSATIRLTDNDRLDAGVRVAPDGNLISWTRCANFFIVECDAVQSERSDAGWTTTVLTGAGRDEYLTATDGTVVAYDTNPHSDIFWQPAGGGVEMQLDLPDPQSWPAVSDGVIVFQSGPVNARDIWAYDTKTSHLYRVTDDPAEDQAPDIEVVNDVATVVWMRLEGDNNDIHARTFPLLREQSAEEQLQALLSTVAESGNHLTKALLAKLTAADQALDADDPASACEALRAFINHVAAQRGKKIAEDEATAWTAAAQAIRAALDCT